MHNKLYKLPTAFINIYIYVLQNIKNPIKGYYLYNFVYSYFFISTARLFSLYIYFF